MKKNLIPLVFFVGLTACGHPPADLEVDQAYCFVVGEDPEVPEYSTCDNISGVFIYRSNGDFETFFPGLSNEMVKVGSFDGVTITLDGMESKAVKKRGHIKLIGELNDDESWLLVAKSTAGNRLKRFDRALTSLQNEADLPTNQPSFVNVPLCYQEQQYRNGRVSGELNSCPSIVTFFTSDNDMISFDVSSLDGDERLDWNVTGTWVKSGNGAVPDNLKEFDWTVAADGTPLAKRQTIEQKITGWQQRRDPNHREIKLAYPLYAGNNIDEIREAYSSVIYPELRRLKLIKRHYGE